jgi:hypothetical protein
MSGIKAKISATVDKLTHKSGTTDNTGTGTGVGGHHSGTGHTGDLSKTGDYNTTSSTGTGAGYGTTGGLDTTTGAGYGTTGQETTTGAGYGTTGVTGTTGHGSHHHTTTTGTGEIIDSETFTKTEDHEVLIEKKRYELEHRPVQKQYVVETRFVGEQQVAGAPTEIVGNETREVDERIKQAPAGDRTVVVENVDIGVSDTVRGATTGHTGTTGTTGQGYGTTGNTGSTY